MRWNGVWLVAILLLCCGVQAQNLLWTEATSGEPGEEVTVVVKATNEVALLYVVVLVQYDTEALTFLGRDFGYSDALEQMESAGGQEYPEHGVCIARIAFDNLAARIDYFPPTENWEVVRFSFRVRSRAASGEYSAGVVPYGPGTNDSTVFDAAGSAPGLSAVPVDIIPGTVTVTPATGPMPPDSFRCVQDIRSVVITWENPIAYDSLSLTRNGAILAELPGDADSFTDAAPPEGVYRYGLTAHVEGEAAITVAARGTRDHNGLLGSRPVLNESRDPLRFRCPKQRDLSSDNSVALRRTVRVRRHFSGAVYSVNAI